MDISHDKRKRHKINWFSCFSFLCYENFTSDSNKYHSELDLIAKFIATLRKKGEMRISLVFRIVDRHEYVVKHTIINYEISIHSICISCFSFPHFTLIHHRSCNEIALQLFVCLNIHIRASHFSYSIIVISTYTIYIQYVWLCLFFVHIPL